MIKKVVMEDGGDFCGLCDEFVEKGKLLLQHHESKKYLCKDCLAAIASMGYAGE